MGRKKSYDREEVAESALQMFWEKGFERTSLRDLEAATGVNRFGLYDSFKDKQGLFEECIEHYCSNNEVMFDDLVERGLEGLLGLIERFALPDPKDKNCHNGCLVVTALLEQDGLSEQVRTRMKRNITYLVSYIHKVLENEQAQGHLRKELNIDESVELVHMALVGLPTMSRISADTTGMQLAARAVMSTMKSWRV